MCSLAKEPRQNTESESPTVNAETGTKKPMCMKKYAHYVICEYWAGTGGYPHKELIEFVIRTFDISGRHRNKEVDEKVVFDTLRHLERESKIRRELQENKDGTQEFHWFPMTLEYDETKFVEAEPRTLKALDALESAKAGEYTAWQINDKLMKTKSEKGVLGEGVTISKTSNALTALYKKGIVDKVGAHKYFIAKTRPQDKKMTKPAPQQLTLGDTDITQTPRKRNRRVSTGLNKQTILGGFREATESSGLNHASSREVGEVLIKRGFDLARRRGVHSFMYGLFKAGVFTRIQDPETFNFRYTLVDQSQTKPGQDRFATVIARVASRNPQDIQDAEYFPDVTDMPLPPMVEPPPTNPTPPPPKLIVKVMNPPRPIPETPFQAKQPITSGAFDKWLQEAIDHLNSAYALAISTAALDRKTETRLNELRLSLIDFSEELSK
jgi:hypothetical protein